MAGNLLPALPARAGRPLRRCFCLNGNTYAEERGNMADHKVTVEQLPSGKWACFLQLPGVADPVNLGKEFKSEERAETWLDVSEAQRMEHNSPKGVLLLVFLVIQSMVWTFLL